MLKELHHVIMTSQLTLPAFELAMLMALLTLGLLFRYSRTGMVVAYLFAYRWGWEIAHGLGRGAHFWYLVFGFIVGILTVLGMLSDSRE